jgi:hypothetical protein
MQGECRSFPLSSWRFLNSGAWRRIVWKVLKFWKKLLPSYSGFFTLKRGRHSFSESSANTYQTTRHRITEHCSFHFIIIFTYINKTCKWSITCRFIQVQSIDSRVDTRCVAGIIHCPTTITPNNKQKITTTTTTTTTNTTFRFYQILDLYFVKKTYHLVY